MGFHLDLVALAVVMAIAWRFLGSCMASVHESRARWLSVVERPVYRIIGVDPESGQSWQRYQVNPAITAAGVRISRPAT